MLEVGNGGLTYEEEKTHFALWVMAKAPLIIGCDLSLASQDSLDILMNQDLIAVNQDPESRQATCFIGCSWIEDFLRMPSVYATKVTGGDTVAMIVNWRERKYKDFEFKIQDIGVDPANGQLIQVWDLWKHDLVGVFTPEELESFAVSEIPGHGNFVYKFKLVDANSADRISQQ